MPRIASEAANAPPRYNFSFAWESAYGHVVELIKRLQLEPGLILDLGCGVGAVAEPLRELGFDYLGADIDTVALEQLTQRGLEAHTLDLARISTLSESLVKLAGGRRVAAVLLLDVIEHMPETRRFLSAVRDGLDALGRPPIFLSVPNVAHADVAAKLVFGRWDYTATGLLDSTHTQFFTAKRLQDEARACGLLELAAHDFCLPASDQRFPRDHPALSPESQVAATIRMWREMADQHGETIQFVRAFAPADTARQTATPVDAAVPSSLAVVMRTQGRRQAHLRDALTCLAAQTVDAFEVLLMVHTATPETIVPSVTAVVDEFDPTFSSRVRVVPVAGGGRARPLNAALDRVQSAYVAFLDDDDLVTADWVEAFLTEIGGGAIVRSVAAVRHVSPPDDDQRVPYVVESGLEFRYDLEFDRVHHLWGNETPICTFAVPSTLIHEFRMRFDEQLPVLEDWDFLMRCVALAPLRDTRRVTSIYQMWRSGESSAALHERELWHATQRMLQERRNGQPLVLPAGSAGRLVNMSEQLAEWDALESALSTARREAQMHIKLARDLQGEMDRVGAELKRIQRAYTITINSRRWRILGPPARLVAAVRRAARSIWSRARGVVITTTRRKSDSGHRGKS